MVTTTSSPSLREYLELLNRIPDVFRRSWDAIAIYDLEGRLRGGNAAARDLVGINMAQGLPGQHYDAHMTLDVARRSARLFAQCVTSGKPLEGDTTFRDSAGCPVPVRVRLVPARIDGKIVGVIGFARDYRALRSVESQFMRSEEQFRSLFEHHPDALALHDLEGRYLRINAATTSLTGYSADELIGETPALLMRAAWTDGSRLIAAVRQGETVTFERELYRKNGERMDVEGVAVPVRVDGEVHGFCGITRDVTEKRRTERESTRAAQRISELYHIAASPAMSAGERIEAALDLARREIGAGFAYVGTPGEDGLDLTHVAGAVPQGYRCGGAISAAPAGAERYDEPLMVGGAPSGAISFANEHGELRLSAGDREYIRAIAALIGSAVQQERREKRLDTLAFHDPLTGLPNRALLGDRLEQALLAARRKRRSVAVHYVDIDRFKTVNDTYGHHVGDAVLVAVAQWLQATLRGSDTVARIGGDEFVVLQPEIESTHQAEELANKLVSIHDRTIRAAGHDIAVRLSVGVAVFPAKGAAAIDMLRAADATLYEVKKNGRNGYKITTVH